MKFTLPIIPTPQRRVRHAKIGGFSRAYKAKEQVRAEDTLNAYLLPHVPTSPLDGPIRLCVRAFLPIPKSKPAKWKVLAKTGEILPTKKPDIDNLVKQICDCCTGMRFWGDDKQIAALTAQKLYSDKPRWEIEIERII